MLPQLPPTLQAEVDAGLVSLEKTSIPGFVNLYRYLTTQVLDHDASTKSQNRFYDESGVSQGLKEVHCNASRDTILIRALREASLSRSEDKPLPQELEELCHVVSSLLSSVKAGQISINNNIEDLIASDLQAFGENLPTIANALSKHILSLERTIANMLEPLIPTTTSRIPSTRHTTRNHTTPPSSTLLQTHLTALAHLQQTTLPTLLTTLSKTLYAYQTTHATHLTSSIRHAEQHTHSTLARHTTSHASFLATVSQGLLLKSQILALQREKEAYAGEGVREALRERFEALVGEERGLREREERLRALLGEFGEVERREGVGKGAFEVLGKGYRDVEAEIEVVRGDLERLQGRR